VAVALAVVDEPPTENGDDSASAEP
jgi:hypothetical protein